MKNSNRKRLDYSEIEHVRKLEIKTANVEDFKPKKSITQEWFLEFPRPEHRSPRVSIWLNRQPISAVVDSGATTSVISKLSLKRIFEGKKYPEVKPVQIKVLSVDKTRMKIDGQVELPTMVGPLVFRHKFLVFDSPVEQVLMGYEMMKKYNMCLYPGFGIGSPPPFQRRKIASTRTRVPVRASQNFYLEPQETVDDHEAMISDQKDQRRKWHGRTIEVSSDYIRKPEVEALPSISKVTSRGKCQVRLYNRTSRAIVVVKYQIIGHAYTPQGHQGEANAMIVARLQDENIREEIIRQCEVLMKEESPKEDIRACFTRLMDRKEKVEIQEDDIPIPTIPKNDYHYTTEKEIKRWDYVKKANLRLKDPKIREFLDKLLTRMEDACSKFEYDVGRAKVEAEIHLKEGATPCADRYRHVPPHKAKAARTIIDELLKYGLIVRGSGPWNSEAVWVFKAQPDLEAGKGMAGAKDLMAARPLRLAIDYRKTNEQIKSDAYPLRPIKSVLHQLQGKHCISVLDLSHSFWQIPLAKKYREIFNFSVFGESYSWTVVPMGMKTSQQILSFYVNQCLASISHCSMSYSDNIIIFSDSVESHKKDLADAMEAIKNFGFKIRTNKSHFFCTEKVKILGFEVDLQEGSLKVDKDKVDPILELPPPKDRKTLKSLIGSVQWFADICPNMGEVLYPLHEASRPTIPYKWTEECQKSFDNLKEILAQYPKCFIAKFEEDFHLFSDASPTFVAAFICQRDKTTNKFVPIAFTSKKLDPTQQRYSQPEREMLGIVTALQAFEYYIYMSHTFIHTDARALTFAQSMKCTNSKIARWSLLLNSFNHSMVWQPNTCYAIRLADIMSRKEPGTIINKRPTEEQIQNMPIIDFSKQKVWTPPEYSEHIEKILKKTDPNRKPDYLNCEKCVSSLKTKKSKQIKPNATTIIEPVIITQADNITKETLKPDFIYITKERTTDRGIYLECADVYGNTIRKTKIASTNTTKNPPYKLGDIIIKKNKDRWTIKMIVLLDAGDEYEESRHHFIQEALRKIVNREDEIKKSGFTKIFIILRHMTPIGSTWTTMKKMITKQLEKTELCFWVYGPQGKPKKQDVNDREEKTCNTHGETGIQTIKRLMERKLKEDDDEEMYVMARGIRNREREENEKIRHLKDESMEEQSEWQKEMKGAKDKEEQEEAMIWTLFPMLNLDEVRRLQEEDKKIGAILGQMRKKKQLPGYVMRQNLLMRKHREENHGVTREWEQLCIPAAIAPQLLFDLHNDRSLAHPARMKMMKMASSKFHIDRLKPLCNNLIANCQKCQRMKCRTRGQRPLLRKIKADRPNFIWSVDICQVEDKIRRKEDTNGKFIAWTDVFSGFTIAHSIPDDYTSEDVLKSYMNRIVQCYGPSYGIISDNDMAMDATIHRQLCSLYGVRKMVISDHSAKSNLVERVNRAILTGLRMNVVHELNCEDVTWEDMLDEVILAWNSSRNATGYSPQYLFTGIENNPALGPHVNLAFVNENYRGFVKRRAQAQRLCHTAVRNFREQQRTKEDIKREEKLAHSNTPTFETGQLVLRRARPNKTTPFHKLRERWTGPFVVRRTSRSAAWLSPFLKEDIVKDMFKPDNRRGEPVPLFSTIKCPAEELTADLSKKMRKIDVDDLKIYNKLSFWAPEETERWAVRFGIGGHDPTVKTYQETEFSEATPPKDRETWLDDLFPITEEPGRRESETGSEAEMSEDESETAEEGSQKSEDEEWDEQAPEQELIAPPITRKQAITRAKERRPVGRPKKNRETTPGTILERRRNETLDKPEPQVEGPEQPRRKRGRPRKVQPPLQREEPEEPRDPSEETKIQEPAQPPRKREERSKRSSTESTPSRDKRMTMTTGRKLRSGKVTEIAQ